MHGYSSPVDLVAPSGSGTPSAKSEYPSTIDQRNVARAQRANVRRRQFRSVRKSNRQGLVLDIFKSFAFTIDSLAAALARQRLKANADDTMQLHDRPDAADDR